MDEYNNKIVLLGESRVGKTSLINNKCLYGYKIEFRRKKYN